MLLTILVTLCLALVSPAVALANSVSAKRGPYNGSVHVKGGPANAVGDIQQTNAAGTFVSLGKTVTTNANGEGRETLRNTRGEGGLICDRQVRVVFPGPVTCGPSTVKYNQKLYDTFVPGQLNDVTVTFDQDVVDAEGVHLDTWEDGANWILRLVPGQATWVNAGAQASSTEGDLSLSIQSVTSSEVTLHIVHDSSPLTANTIIIQGLRVNVPVGISTVRPEIGLLGSVTTHVDGVLTGTETTTTPTFVDALPITATTVLPSLGSASLALLFLLLAACGVLALRRAGVER